MYGLEYSSLIVDVICGFVCTILGLLHYFDVAKPFEKVTGIIGLATGIIGFVLTFVYLVYSTYIFTNDPYDDGDGHNIFKRDGDWAFAKKEGSEFKCIFYKEGDKDSIFAKYSDLGKNNIIIIKKRVMNIQIQILVSFSQNIVHLIQRHHYHYNVQVLPNL